MSTLTREEKNKLVTGMGSWHTNDLGGKLTSIHLTDGPHGLRAQSEDAASNNDSYISTCFPTASASACSFDPDMLNQMGEAIAEEAIEIGASVVLGPGVNMKRSPLCGRNFEYFSEDPYLAGELATGFVRGLQNRGIGASLKHFAGNSQETHRMTSNSEIDERALREIYLRAFEKVVKEANPATIMASYNLLNGKPACENEWLLTKVLRDEWGYDGLVMSDWGACVDLSACVNAGMDLEMPDSMGNHSADGVTEEALERATSRLLALIDRYKSDKDTFSNTLSEDILDKHHCLARKISLESAVLLKNENALPLNNPQRVIVIGDLAKQMRVQGGGSSHIKTRTLPTVITALQEAGVEVTYYRGYDADADSLRDSSLDARLRQQVVGGLKGNMASGAGAPVIICGGLTDRAEGEGYDRDTLSLPLNQIKLYQAIKEITDQVIYVSFGGSPYDISPIEYAQAILSMYLGGEGAAEAVVDILLAKENPSGRLAETWPLSIEDTPCYGFYGTQNATPHDVEYRESIYIGYRYYDTFNVRVRYPFGYGLSYTSFSYDNMEVLREDGRWMVSLDVTNTGAMRGKDTILIFVKNPSGNIIRASRELRGFGKVSLEAGERTTVHIALDDRAFDIYDVNRQTYVTVSGEYIIEASACVGDVICSQCVVVDGENPTSQRDSYPSYFSYNVDGSLRDGERFSEGDFVKLYAHPRTDLSHVRPGEFTTKNSLEQMAPYTWKARALKQVGRVATRLMTQSPLDDPESRMMLGGIIEGNIDSVCNQSGGIVSKKLIDNIVKSANRG